MYTYISCPLDLPTSHPSQSPHSAKLSSLWYIHSSFPLVIYSTHHSVYISDPVSQFIPTSPSSLVSVCPFPTSVSVFLPYKEVHQYCFSRFHIYAFRYITFLFLTYFSKEWVSVFQRNWFCLDIPFKKAGKIVQLICGISEPQEVWEVGGGGECDVGCPNEPIQWSRWGTTWGRGHLDLPTWPWDGLGLFNGCWLSTYWSWQGCRMVKVGLPQWLRWWRICMPMQETWAPTLTREAPLVEERATHSSTLAWEIPLTEEPGGLQSTGSQSRTQLSKWTHTPEHPDFESPHEP